MDYRLSNRFLRLAVLFALIGMSLGYWMGATEQFAASPVHAHINLLGWVSMALYGLFYRVQPGAARGWLPAIHFWITGFCACSLTNLAQSARSRFSMTSKRLATNGSRKKAAISFAPILPSSAQAIASL